MGISNITSRVTKEFSQDIWTRDLSAATAGKRRAFTLLKWIYLVAHGFWKDQCMGKAAALTYTTVLSIVPFLAVAFSISKGLGLQNQEVVHDALMKLAGGRAEVVDQIVAYIDNTNLKTLGWMGMGMLFVTVISLVGTVEKTFNAIWNVPKGRTLWRKFTDFFSVTLLCPVGMIIATGVTVSLQKQSTIQKVLGVVHLGGLESVIMGLMPLFMIWLVFIFINSFVPNVRVRIWSAVVGGIVSGSLWQLAQWGYIRYQVGVAKYNAIYGSFAQLPLFLVWLYLSWAIMLIGAEISYAVQHLRTFEGDRLSSLAGTRTRQKVALLAMLLLADRFEKRLGPASVEDLSEVMGAPTRLINQVFVPLCEVGLAVKAENEETDAYALSSSPDSVRIMDVGDAVAGYGQADDQVIVPGEPDEMEQALEELSGYARAGAANLTLRELAGRMTGAGFTYSEKTEVETDKAS